MGEGAAITVTPLVPVTATTAHPLLVAGLSAEKGLKRRRSMKRHQGQKESGEKMKIQKLVHLYIISKIGFVCLEKHSF